MPDNDLENLVTHADELRQQLGGRTPDYFRFYWKEYRLGTVGMTAAAKGAYVDLLCHQADKGSLPVDIGALLVLGGIQGTTDVLGEVLGKFVQVGDRLYNVKLLREWIAAAESTVQSRTAAKNRRRKGKDIGDTY